MAVVVCVCVCVRESPDGSTHSTVQYLALVVSVCVLLGKRCFLRAGLSPVQLCSMSPSMCVCLQARLNFTDNPSAYEFFFTSARKTHYLASEQSVLLSCIYDELSAFISKWLK